MFALAFSLLALGGGASARNIVPANTLTFGILGTYKQDDPEAVFGESAAEVVRYDACTMRVLVTNKYSESVDVLDLSDPGAPVYLSSFDPEGTPNSVDIYDGLAAVAVEDSGDPQAPGHVILFDVATLTKLKKIIVGANPQMLRFTPDGQLLLTADAGEPNDSYTVDPEGSVSIIDVEKRELYETAIFTQYNGMEEDLRAQGIRIFGPGASAAQDFEPQYIAVSDDSKTAVVVLQENNALAVINIKKGEVENLVPLGYKDHSMAGNELDASNRDDAINIQDWPVRGMYQPDGFEGFTIGKRQYYISANEGVSRDFEEQRVGDVCGQIPEFTAEMCLDKNLGRIRTTNSNENDAGEYDEVLVFGGRSFSIFDEDLNMIFESGSWLEDITASVLDTDGFNAGNEENGFDERSDDKGPEPEGLRVAVIDGKTFAFVLMEQVSAIAVFDVSDPSHPIFDQLLYNRDYTADDSVLMAGNGGDLGPEDAAFIPAEDSPNGENLLVVANEVTGSVTVWSVEVTETPPYGKKGKSDKSGKSDESGKSGKKGKSGSGGKKCKQYY